MNTPKQGRKLSRTSSHRIALLRNLSTSLFKHDKIETTYPKAKELESFAGKLINFARTNDVTSKRRVFQDIRENAVLEKLFAVIAPKYAEKKGGCIKVIKSGRRKSDGASMAVVKLV